MEIVYWELNYLPFSLRLQAARTEDTSCFMLAVDTAVIISDTYGISVK